MLPKIKILSPLSKVPKLSSNAIRSGVCAEAYAGINSITENAMTETDLCTEILKILDLT
jgi:hypothetical protein